MNPLRELLARMRRNPAASASQRGSATADTIGRDLRDMFLRTSATQAGLVRTEEFSEVYGAALDWPVGSNTATVVSLCDGTASLYTNASFGILGGVAHESVQLAAKRFVKAVGEHLGRFEGTSSFPYPGPGKARFYALCYAGAKTLEVSPAQIQSQAWCAALFGAGQDVVTELRQVTSSSEHGV